MVWGTNFSTACTFKISRYASDYQYLIAFEIDAQGWGGGVGVGYFKILKNCLNAEVHATRKYN